MHDKQRVWPEQAVGFGVERAVYLITFAVIVAGRIPAILLKGRFWAEEGDVFFVKAWVGPWWKAVLAPYGGYLDLVPNIGALVANLLPLDAAPYGSSAVAFVVQCFPAILIVASRDSWLQPRVVMGTALLLIGMAVAADEVWISSIGCTVHLALATALILALEVPRKNLLLFQLFVLLLAALTAPGSWILALLFIARAAIERSKARATQGIVLLFGVIIQLVFFYSKFGRTVEIAPSVFGAIVFVKNILVPFLGVVVSDRFVPSLVALYNQQGGPIWPLMISAGVFSLLAGFALRHSNKAPVWFLLAAAVVASSGYIGAFEGDKLSLISTGGAARYAVCSQILLGLALLSWSRGFQDWTRYAAGALTTWILVIDLIGYFHNPWLDYCSTGPPWRDEVVKWRHDPQYALKLWPAGWKVKLPLGTKP